MELTDDELHSLDDSMCGDRECVIPFARAVIAADRDLQATEIAAKDTLLRQALDAFQAAIEWDKTRNFPIPYRVRDPIHAATEAITKHLEQTK